MDLTGAPASQLPFSTAHSSAESTQQSRHHVQERCAHVPTARAMSVVTSRVARARDAGFRRRRRASRERCVQALARTLAGDGGGETDGGARVVEGAAYARYRCHARLAPYTTPRARSSASPRARSRACDARERGVFRNAGLDRAPETAAACHPRRRRRPLDARRVARIAAIRPATRREPRGEPRVRLGARTPGRGFLGFFPLPAARTRSDGDVCSDARVFSRRRSRL